MLVADAHRRAVEDELGHPSRFTGELGLAEVWVKDESNRLDLPSFKILGASWAVSRLLVEKLGHEPAFSTLSELRAAVAPLGPLTLVAATDGNHGRAVARMACLLGYACRILVPRAPRPPASKASSRRGRRSRSSTAPTTT